jgi:hypothetical protein
MSSTHIHCLKCSFNYYVHYTNVCKTNIDCWSTPSGHSCSLPGVLDTTLRDQFCQWLAAFRWIFFGYPVFLHQLNWSPRYNWNIVENGVNQPNINYYAIIFWIMRIKIFIITYWLANCFKVYMNIYGLIRTTFWKVSPLLANYISTITYMVKILEDRNLKLVFAVFL